MAVTLEEARILITSQVAPLEVEDCSLLNALGRALSQDVIASRDLPAWNNSAMDGYAVRAEDCPIGDSLVVTGCVLAGSKTEIAVEPGCAVKIMTGAPVPAGADAVIPFEMTEQVGDRVIISGKVVKDDHIRIQGEDVGAGELALAAGTLLRPEEIGMLASLGSVSAPVHRQPRVAILSTGDELTAPGDPLVTGQVVDSNSFALSAAVKAAGAIPALLGIAPDDRDVLKQMLSRAADFDVIITSAGVSAGERDLVREVLAELGCREIFWKVLLKPGFPTAFGLLGDMPVFCLPGNPVSAMMVFEQLVRPALLKMMGHRLLTRPLLRASLMEPLRKKPGRLSLVRVRLCQKNRQLVAYSAGSQQSGILSTSLQANAVAFLPAEKDGATVGDEVEVQLLGECIVD